jgi:hydrogenase maturation protease
VNDTLIIGLGNPLRGDDAVGHRVIEALGDQVPEGTAVRRCEGDPLGLLHLAEWDEADRIILVDAVRSGRPPGTIHHVVLDGYDLPARPLTSGHGIDIGDVVRLAARLHRLPRRVVLIGVEVAELGLGTVPAPATEAAVQRVLGILRAELWGEVAGEPPASTVT